MDASGFLNVDKPLGLTSHAVVAAVRRAFGMKRVGHAGTLDPLATGVLVICLGPATRLSEYVMDTTKQYRARVRLGATTSTYDAEGDVIERMDAAGVTREQVEAALSRFLGDIDQLPPLYSAVKQGGRKLYALARAGEAVDRAPRRVTIHALDIAAWQPPEFTLAVTCGAGTYIRSLAHDLGQALGVGAYLAGLVRTASGSFTLAGAIPLDVVASSADPSAYVVPARVALAGRPSVQLDAAQVAEIRHGRAILAGDFPPHPIVFAYTPEGEFAAVLRAEDGSWKPQKVFLGGSTG